MRFLLFAFVVLSHLPIARSDENVPYAEEINTWRALREKRLRADNGWLTLAGRFTLKEGANTFGTGKKNDIVFPQALEGVGPDSLGTLEVDVVNKAVTLKLVDAVSMVSGDKPFTGSRRMGTLTDKRDWVALERLSMHVIERNEKYVLRLADNESPVRNNFPGVSGIRLMKPSRLRRGSSPMQRKNCCRSSISLMKCRAKTVLVMPSLGSMVNCTDSMRFRMGMDCSSSLKTLLQVTRLIRRAGFSTLKSPRMKYSRSTLISLTILLVRFRPTRRARYRRGRIF